MARRRKKARKSSTAPKRKRSRGRARSRVRRAMKGAGGLLASRPMDALFGLGEMTAGALATSFAISKTPKVNTLSPMWKSGIQVALGFLVMKFVPNKHAKRAGAGSIIAGTMGAAKKLLTIDPMAGGAEARTLSASELRALASGANGMGIPQSLGVPADVRMGVPADVRMSGSADGWSLRN